jgi:phospho-N-acetylmuramoyl-pentapeptide-transferase
MNIHSFTTDMTATFMLSVGAFLLAMLLTPAYTYFAYRYKFWKKQRSTSTLGETLEVFTKLHADKFTRTIPTMAGIIGILSFATFTYFLIFDRAETWLTLAALLGGGAVGLLDDVINIRGSGKGVAGLRSSLKFIMIIGLSLVLGWFFYSRLGYNSVHIPFLGDWELGIWIVPLFVLAVVSTGNAVNISDGLDGLAGGLLGISYSVFGVIGLLQGHLMIAGFCFTVVGAILSYLWFNIYPARFFMGDVGSFAYGTSLGVIAMLTNTLFLLPIIGIIFVAEAGSSLIQIASKKLFHRKIFLSAPVHHHLEAIGWPETKVTMRFWVIGCVAGFIGLLLALSGGHI